MKSVITTIGAVALVFSVNSVVAAEPGDIQLNEVVTQASKETAVKPHFKHHHDMNAIEIVAKPYDPSEDKAYIALTNPKHHNEVKRYVGEKAQPSKAVVARLSRH
jgi:hypothetical protein